MSITQTATTVDCDDVAKVAAFWSAAMDRPLSPEGSEFFQIMPPGGPGQLTWLFIKVPEHKTAKNRMHADFTSSDRAADVARLVGLGATHVGAYDEWGARWTTLRDVEGNEFCVADKTSEG